jgi:hypothetical protein
VDLAKRQANFRQTLGRIEDCRNALQHAFPYSACTIAYASSFAYHAGILCYTAAGNLRILNFNHRRGTEKVLEGNVLVNHVLVTRSEGALIDLESLQSLQVLDYANDTAVLYCDFGAFGQYVFAVDISEGRPSSRPSSEPRDGRHPRVRLCVPVRSPNKLFVRHSSHFFVMGSHSATGSHGHHEWLIQVFNLDKGEAVNVEPLQLQDFYGSEIGSTVCFIIHDGCFYAVTNQTSFESEEVDWTSYYHVVQFSLEDPFPELVIHGIYRRQHLEGPINDAWTDLGFQIDQCTGELLLVECRKEWVNGGSRSIRSYYTQSMNSAKRKNLSEALRHPPTADRLISTLDEHSNSKYEEPEVRINRYVHAEFPAINEEGAREYIRAKTKWNGYDFNAQSFVDLVTDEYIPEGGWKPQQRLRLRVVSRRELCPLIRDETSTSPTSLIIRPRIINREREQIDDSERAFSPSQVYLWPPDDAPQELHDILCPGGRAGDVKAILGDEGLIYMAGPVRPGSSERALVFICFDPTFGFNGMKRLDGSFAVAKRDMKRKSDEVDQEVAISLSMANQISSGTSNLAELTKRPKIHEMDSHLSVKPSCSTPTEAKMEVDVGVLAQGDGTSQALGLDLPSPLCLVSQAPASWRPELPSDLPSHSPAACSSSMRTPSPSAASSPPTAVPCKPERSANGKCKDKGKAKGKSSTLSTWRENAAYLGIGEGFWLR